MSNKPFFQPAGFSRSVMERPVDSQMRSKSLIYISGIQLTKTFLGGYFGLPLKGRFSINVKIEERKYKKRMTDNGNKRSYQTQSEYMKCVTTRWAAGLFIVLKLWVHSLMSFGNWLCVRPHTHTHTHTLPAGSSPIHSETSVTSCHNITKAKYLWKRNSYNLVWNWSVQTLSWVKAGCAGTGKT